MTKKEIVLFIMTAFGLIFLPIYHITGNDLFGFFGYLLLLISSTIRLIEAFRERKNKQ